VAERSKTKQKILKTSLGLFNNEGEGLVSSVDIASVMAISPGNLYYHYKGKDEIISALFDDFEEEIRMVLSAPIKEPLQIEDNWVYLYIIFEEIYDFRFFYRNLSQLLARIPDLASRFASILAQKERMAQAFLSPIEESGILIFEPGEKTALAGRLAQHFTFWLQYHDLRHGTSATAKSLIDQGVFNSLIQIAPYANPEVGMADLLKDFLERQSK